MASDYKCVSVFQRIHKLFWEQFLGRWQLFADFKHHLFILLGANKLPTRLRDARLYTTYALRARIQLLHRDNLQLDVFDRGLWPLLKRKSASVGPHDNF